VNRGGGGGGSGGGGALCCCCSAMPGIIRYLILFFTSQFISQLGNPCMYVRTRQKKVACRRRQFMQTRPREPCPYFQTALLRSNCRNAGHVDKMDILSVWQSCCVIARLHRLVQISARKPGSICETSSSGNLPTRCTMTIKQLQYSRMFDYNATSYFRERRANALFGWADGPLEGV
jgi:hypothetical protein